jgi:hypothetical protein
MDDSTTIGWTDKTHHAWVGATAGFSEAIGNGYARVYGFHPPQGEAITDDLQVFPRLTYAHEELDV